MEAKTSSCSVGKSPFSALTIVQSSAHTFLSEVINLFVLIISFYFFDFKGDSTDRMCAPNKGRGYFFLTQ